LKKKSRIVMTLLVLLWAGVIFWFSAQNAEQSDQTSGQIVEKLISLIVPGYDGMTADERAQVLHTVTFLIRKGAHFSEYLVFGGLLWGWCVSFSFSGKALFWGPWMSGSVYAITDELHQMFSEGRSPQIGDVGIDSAGVVCGVMLCFLGCLIWKQVKRGRK